MVERAMKKRRHKPMFMVDIAVPRDIEEEVSEVSDVYLYTVDDLRDIIEENIRSRESAAEQAETLIDSGVEQFMRDLKVLDAVKTITEVRTHVHDLKDEQLAIALKKLVTEPMQNKCCVSLLILSLIKCFMPLRFPCARQVLMGV